MDITDILLAVLSLVVAASSLFNTRKKDTRNEGAQQASLQADLNYIKEMLQDVRTDMKDVTKSNDVHTEKIAKIEEQMQSVLRRIKRLEQQIDGTKES